MSKIEQLTSLENYSSLLCKSQFGKRPDSIEIRTNERCIVFLLRGLIDESDVRLPKDPDERYTHVYILLDQFISPSLRPKIESVSNTRTSYSFIDWKKDSNAAMIAIFLEPTIDEIPEDLYAGKASLHQYVDSVTIKDQKSPIAIESFRMEGGLLLIVRYGLMIGLEKRFIKKGFNSQLRLAKREVELDGFGEELPFDELLHRKLKAAYLDWAFEDDVSLLLLELDGDVP